MSPPPRRSRYGEAIDKVRAEHGGSVAPARSTMECPRCGTKQVITDVPGMRRCIKCGYEFRQR